MTARAIVLLLVLIGFVAAKADVKVMAFTYNINDAKVEDMGCGMYSNVSTVNPGLIFVSLQEVDKSLGAKYKPATHIRDCLPSYSLIQEEWGYSRMGHGHSGIAAFRRNDLQVEEADHFLLTAAETAYIGSLKVDHAKSWALAQVNHEKCLGVVTFKFNGKTIAVLGGHFPAKNEQGPRRSMLKEVLVKHVLKRHPDMWTTFLMGDFNFRTGKQKNSEGIWAELETRIMEDKLAYLRSLDEFAGAEAWEKYRSKYQGEDDKELNIQEYVEFKAQKAGYDLKLMDVMTSDAKFQQHPSYSLCKTGDDECNRSDFGGVDFERERPPSFTDRILIAYQAQPVPKPTGFGVHCDGQSDHCYVVAEVTLTDHKEEL